MWCEKKYYNIILYVLVYTHIVQYTLLLLLLYFVKPYATTPRAASPTDNRYSHYYCCCVKYISSIIIYACALLGCPRSCARKCIIYDDNNNAHCTVLAVVRFSRFGGKTAAAISIYYSVNGRNPPPPTRNKGYGTTSHRFEK